MNLQEILEQNDLVMSINNNFNVFGQFVLKINTGICIQQRVRVCFLKIKSTS